MFKTGGFEAGYVPSSTALAQSLVSLYQRSYIMAHMQYHTAQRNTVRCNVISIFTPIYLYIYIYVQLHICVHT